jgi:L-fuconolactonase
MALTVCDAHHHLWDRPGNRYGVEELRADVGGRDRHDVRATVFVECGAAWDPGGPEAFRPVGETRFVAAEAARSEGLIAAIVGYADLRRHELDDVLSAHVEAGGGRFRGIRQVASRDDDPAIHTSHTDPPHGLYADPSFHAGLRRLGDRDLSFDAYLYHPQLPDLIAAVRAAPDTLVVLDHIGTPLGIGAYAGRRQAVLADWRASMATLATAPNVVVKLGGIGMPIFGDGWHEPSAEDIADVWGEPIRWVIDTFGADRCLFESNFPVDKVSADHGTLYDAFELMVAGASPADRAALFHDNAARTYRLPRASAGRSVG